MMIDDTDIPLLPLEQMVRSGRALTTGEMAWLSISLIRTVTKIINVSESLSKGDQDNVNKGLLQIADAMAQYTAGLQKMIEDSSDGS